jgi:hypothetical protein
MLAACDGGPAPADDGGGPDGSTTTDAGTTPSGCAIPPPPTCDVVDTDNTVPLDVRGATGAATDDFGGSTCGVGRGGGMGGTGAKDIAFRFIAPEAGVYEISTVGSDFDTVLSIRDGCDGEELACNDDVSRSVTQSIVEITLEECQTIIIIVDRNSADASGNVVVTVATNESVCDDDLSSGAFPFMAAREIRVGSVPVRALRATYTGELGWELHHPIEYSRSLHDLLIEAGGPLGLADIGYRALESLRLEKGYRLWGVDIMPSCTPLEAGLERFVRFEKGDFIGRDALLRQRDAGIARSLACLTIDLQPADDLFPHGGEPIHAGGAIVSYLLAADRGHSVGQTIGLAYLPLALAEPGMRLEVEILGERRRASVVEAPLYDPRGERMRG